MGCRSKHKFTVLYYVALPLSVKNSSLVIETLWTKQAVGFIQFGGFHVVLLQVRFPIFCLRLFFPMTAYDFSDKCANLQGFQCTDMCIYCNVLFMSKRQPGCQGSYSLLHLETKCTVLGQVTYFHYKRANSQRMVIGELPETTSLKQVCTSGLSSKHAREVHFVDE